MSLSRLQVGRDVPWVTSWSEEGMGGARPCPSVGGALALWQVDRPGHGRPQYSRNHLVRQRLSVAQMLCPMCGAPTADDDRWTQTARRTTAGALRAAGLEPLIPAELSQSAVMIDAGGIAPLHHACAERSLAQCPHLSGMPDLTIERFPRAWLVAPLTAAAAGGAAPPAIAFLQLFGVTGEREKRWRKLARAG